MALPFSLPNWLSWRAPKLTPSQILLFLMYYVWCQMQALKSYPWMQIKIMMIKNWNSASGWRKLRLLIWKSTVKKFYILSIYTKFIRMWWFQVRRQRMAVVAPNLLLILYQIKRRKVDKNTLNPKHEHYSAPTRLFGFKLHNCHAKGQTIKDQ